MKRRYATLWGVVGLSLIFTSLICAATVRAKTVRIGMVSDGDSSQFRKTRDILLKEIQSMTHGAHRVHFPVDMQVNGGWKVKQINQALDRLMASEKVDMVLAVGEVTAHEVCRRRNFSKPVFAVHVADANLQGIPARKGTSGIPNLNYINTLFDMERELKSFQRITPFLRMTLVVDEWIHTTIPQLDILTRRVAEKLSLEVMMVNATDSAEKVLDQIPPETDAVFLASLPRLSDHEFRILADGLIARKLPGFSLRGRSGVQQGLLAETVAPDNRLHLARNVAVNIQEVLDGADAGTLPTLFAPNRKLTINMATARAIQVFPSWDLLTEAELIHDEPLSGKRRLNLNMAMQEALTANLDLAAANRSVKAGMAQVKEAESFLLPQLNLSTQGTMVDDDRAEANAGMLPERHWTGSIEATQLIYSDKAWAGFAIEKHLQKAREQGRDAVRLDILEASADAYLNVLRAKSVELIQKENLKLTRKNLERARIRVEIGAGGPEEVFRWENQIAVSRRNVLRAQSVTLDTVTAMNNILNRPLREMFVPEETDDTDPLSILPDRRLTRYMNNSLALAMLRDFLVTEGLKASPELQQT